MASNELEPTLRPTIQWGIKQNTWYISQTWHTWNIRQTTLLFISANLWIRVLKARKTLLLGMYCTPKNGTTRESPLLTRLFDGRPALSSYSVTLLRLSYQHIFIKPYKTLQTQIGPQGLHNDCTTTAHRQHNALHTHCTQTSTFIMQSENPSRSSIELYRHKWRAEHRVSSGSGAQLWCHKSNIQFEVQSGSWLLSHFPVLFPLASRLSSQCSSCGSYLKQTQIWL